MEKRWESTTKKKGDSVSSGKTGIGGTPKSTLSDNARGGSAPSAGAVASKDSVIPPKWKTGSISPTEGGKEKSEDGLKKSSRMSSAPLTKGKATDRPVGRQQLKPPPPPPVAKRSLPPQIPRKTMPSPIAAPAASESSYAANLSPWTHLPGGAHRLVKEEQHNFRTVPGSLSTMPPTASMPPSGRSSFTATAPPFMNAVTPSRGPAALSGKKPFSVLLGDKEEDIDLRLSGTSRLHTVKAFLSQKRNLVGIGAALGLLLILVIGISLSSSADDSEKAAPDQKLETPRENNATRAAASKAETQKAETPPESPPPALPLPAASPTPAPEEAALEPAASEQKPDLAEQKPDQVIQTASTEPSALRDTGVSEKAHIPEKKKASAAGPETRGAAGEKSTSKTESSSKSSSTIEKASPIFGDDGPQELPITISRDAVQAGMNSVAGRVKKCSKKETRPIVMAVTIDKNGKVTDVAATGSFAGTDLGDCVAGVVRTATFSKAQRDTTVKYPFHF